MATKLLVQRIGGRTFPHILEVPNEVVEGLLGIMEGRIEIFDFKAQGGTATSTTPPVLNTVRISVRIMDDGSMVSCSFRVPHIKATVDYSTLDGLIRGKFNAHWNSETKCDDMAVLYDKEAPVSNEANNGG